MLRFCLALSSCLMLCLGAIAAATTPVAAEPHHIENVQIETGETTSHTVLEAHEAQAAGGAATAAGVTASAVIEDDRGADIASVQGIMGPTQATSALTAWRVGTAVNTASALGAGLTATVAEGTLRVDSLQAHHATADVLAVSASRTDQAGLVADSASAGGTVAALEAQHGALQGRLVQWSASSVRAVAEGDHCCVGLASGAAIASANNITASAAGGLLDLSTDQRAQSQEISAEVDLFAGYAGDMVGVSTANANSLTAGGAYAPVSLSATQDSAAAVRSETTLTAGGDFLGVMSGSSYGVGNSIVGSSIGADGGFFTSQTNSGPVAALTVLEGTGGVGAVGSSTAFGNLSSGSVCAFCADASLHAQNSQTNSGAVSAATRVAVRGVGAAAAQSTAIGNAATYTVVNGSGR